MAPKKFGNITFVFRAIIVMVALVNPYLKKRGGVPPPVALQPLGGSTSNTSGNHGPVERPAPLVTPGPTRGAIVRTEPPGSSNSRSNAVVSAKRTPMATPTISGASNAPTASSVPLTSKRSSNQPGLKLQLKREIAQLKQQRLLQKKKEDDEKRRKQEEERQLMLRKQQEEQRQLEEKKRRLEQEHHALLANKKHHVESLHAMPTAQLPYQQQAWLQQPQGQYLSATSFPTAPWITPASQLPMPAPTISDITLVSPSASPGTMAAPMTQSGSESQKEPRDISQSVDDPSPTPGEQTETRNVLADTARSKSVFRILATWQ
jgi:hypothetical protein